MAELTQVDVTKGTGTNLAADTVFVADAEILCGFSRKRHGYWGEREGGCVVVVWL
jgi:hypothetical protein